METLLNEKLAYALNEKNELVSILDVERGLSCNCICPSCRGRFIAKKGKIKIPHFAHYKCVDCHSGTQTAIHILAKELIQRNGYITLPDGRRFQIDKCLLEKRLDTLVPDIIVYCKNRPLIIEIFVTHKVDEAKKEKIEEMNISAMEIDLSKQRYDLSKETVNELINTKENIKWVFNVVENEKLKQEFRKYKYPEIRFYEDNTCYCYWESESITKEYCLHCPCRLIYKSKSYCRCENREYGEGKAHSTYGDYYAESAIRTAKRRSR